MKTKLITDKMRMDFLESNRGGCNDVEGGHVWQGQPDGRIFHWYGSTKREALDKALCEEPPDTVN